MGDKPSPHMNCAHDPKLLDKMSSDQIESLNLFSERISDIDRIEFTNKTYLSRWLRARQWDVHEAEQLLRNHIKWRIQNDIDSLIETYKPSPLMQACLPGGFCGHDKSGRPLFVCPIGRIDIKGVLTSFSTTDLIRNRIYLLEKIVYSLFSAESRRQGCFIDHAVILVDLDGVGLHHLTPAWVSTLYEMVGIMESHYPEILHSCFIVNTAPIFGTIFNFIKPLLSQETKDKIHVLKPDFKQYLLKHFDPSQLPAYYGGSMTDNGDPQCPSRICWGGSVNQLRLAMQSAAHFSSSASHRPDQQQNLTIPLTLPRLIEVNRGSQAEIAIGDLSIGSRLRCCVIPQVHDINFSLFLGKPTSLESTDQTQKGPCLTGGIRKSSSFHTGLFNSPSYRRELIEVFPVRRISAYQPNEVFDSSRIDSLIVSQPGYYFIRLDNSYSWTKSKRVWYNIEVTQPPPIVIEVLAPSSSQEPIESRDQSKHRRQHGNDQSNEDIVVFPIPPESRPNCLLETGGSMDVNVSLLSRLLIQYIVLPKVTQKLNSR